MRRKETLLSIVLLVAVLAPQCSAVEQQHEPLILGGVELDVAQLSKKSPLSLKHIPAPGLHHAIVQFSKPLSPDERKTIRQRQVDFLQYIPPYAYFISGTREAFLQLERHKNVVGVILVPHEVKLDEVIRSSARTPSKTQGKKPSAIRREQFKVVFFEDTSFKQARRALAANGAIPAATQTDFDFRQTIDSVRIPVHRVEDLAKEDCVYLITEVDPPARPLNLDAQDTSNVDEIQPKGDAGYNLDGSGVTVGVWDVGRVNINHEQILDRAKQMDSAAFGFNDHASHVAGTIAGSGTKTVQAKGMAPAAKLLCWDTGSDLREMDQYAHLISISNHSYASSISEETDRQHRPTASYGHLGIYGTISQAWDRLVDDHDVIVIRSAGNERRFITADGESTMDNPYPEEFDTILSVAAAKNLISVGAVEDLTDEPPVPDDNSMTGFSSWGPTNDGRIKPDVVANGRRLYSMIADADDAYASNSGTSMSGPTVAGIAACLVQQFRKTFDGADPTSATMKSILIHTAIDGGSLPGPDYRFGWGLVDARAAADFIFKHGVDGNHIELGAYSDTVLQYPMTYTGSGPIKATMVWKDPPGIPISGSLSETTPNLVNDLNLHVFAPDGTYFPYTLDPSAPLEPARQDTENHRDNVEQVFIESPVEGSYAIWVDGQVNLGDAQEFALCISGLEYGGDAPHAMHTVIMTPKRSDILSETVPIRAHFIDNQGASKMTFNVDGAVIDDPETDEVEGEIIFESPENQGVHSAQWDSSTVANGSHTIEVTVTSSDDMTHTRGISAYVINEVTYTELLLDGPTKYGRTWPSEDEDWFVFEAPDSATYTVETLRAWDLQPMDTVLTLYASGAESSPIAVNDDGGRGILSRITQVFEGGHDYLVKVSSFGKATGAYGIRLRTATEEPTAQIVNLEVNGPKVSSFEITSDLDQWYRFTTERFGTYHIVTSPVSDGVGAGPQILLYDSNNEKVLASSTRGTRLFSRVLPGGQTYLVNAVLSKESPDAYLIGVENETVGELTELVLDGPELSGHLPSAATGEAWYWLRAPSGGTYMVAELASVTEEFVTGPNLSLYGPRDPNELVRTGDPRPSERIRKKLASMLRGDRVYYLKVEPEGWSGGYTIAARELEIGTLYSITRSFSAEGYTPGESMRVTLEVSTNGDTLVNVDEIVEVLPPGWTAGDLSSPGFKQGMTGIFLRWPWVPEGTNKVTYTAFPPDDAAGFYSFYGQLSYRIGKKLHAVFTLERRRIGPAAQGLGSWFSPLQRSSVGVGVDIPYVQPKDNPIRSAMEFWQEYR